MTRPPPATFDDYESRSAVAAMGHDDDDPYPEYAALGLAGEVSEFLAVVEGHPELSAAGLNLSRSIGRFCEQVKKARRKKVAIDKVEAVSELGDVLWYLARACRKIGVPLSTVAYANGAKLSRRKTQGKSVPGERAMIASILATAASVGSPVDKVAAAHRRAEAPKCRACGAEPAGLAGYCSPTCEGGEVAAAPKKCAWCGERPAQPPADLCACCGGEYA